MPTILTPQGWVKVAPPPPRKKQPVSNPRAALRGPLAYLACQAQAPTLNVKGGNVSKGAKAPFPYDLSASPEALKRQSQASRTVSAPVMHGALRPGEDEIDTEIRNVSPSPESKPKSKSRNSRHHHHHNDDDGQSVVSSGSNLSSTSGSSSSSKSSASSRSSAPSVKSYTRHRPVEVRPPPHAESQPPAGPRDYFYPAAPRYEHQHHFAHPPAPQVVHVPIPMGTGVSNGRSLSYSWYNATTPLNIK
ncbi:hypothetical protein A1O7_04529 [Cladophialophora yegresii CBS 114405]|uniref:Uncharacterized protein n=1 Tax=Cladophialophora yegresii CBS 114405 TaxID=1182544 RepID=W9VX44_9EURO|nr:uncharacterized protein A1O7_04529 [Cladophialophora yegresii CBS 114405]EXJ60377.1 hypothetical protein A1O7_04529 [Cladophialophora yegresii CBS 114405]